MSRDRLAAVAPLIIALLLFLGTALLFSRGATYGFIAYDDPSYVTANPHVQGGFTRANIDWAFRGHTELWQPLTWMSHMLDWKIYGGNARGHHASSVLWHALNTVLLFFVARRCGLAVAAAAICAALFAWHPLRVESVTWISERKDILGGTFFLLTLWTYLTYAQRRENGERDALRFYFLALIAHVLGLMAKPTVVAAPAVMLALDFWPLRRFSKSVSREKPSAANTSPARRWVELSLEKIPFLILSAIIAFVTVNAQQSTGAFTLRLSFSERVENGFVAIARYLGKYFWPNDLTVVYPHPGHWPTLAIVSAVILFAVLCGVAWQQRTKQPWLLAGWAWFLAMLLPVIGLIQVGFQSMADRYTYNAAIGLNLALIGTWTALAPRWRRLGAGVFCGALIALAARTWQQQSVWQSSRALFEHALQVTRDNFVGHNFLALVDLNDHRVSEAEAECEKALALRPDYALAWDTLGVIRREQGRPDEALNCFEHALSLDPDLVRASFDVGLQLLARNQIDAAAARIEHAAKLQPDSQIAETALAQLAYARGNLDEAARHYRSALERFPNVADLHHSYALVLFQQGKIPEAKIENERALELSPDNAEAHAGLGQALAELGDMPRAETEMKRALELRPQDRRLRLSIADLWLHYHLPAQAEAVYRDGLRVTPEDASLHVSLGELLLGQGQVEAARDEFSAAAKLSPDLAAAYLGLAKAARSAEAMDGVVRQLRGAAERFPASAALHSLLGDLLARERRFDLAEISYQRAVAASPNVAEIHAKLGFIYYLEQRPKEAVTEWKEALRLQPDFPGLKERIEAAQQP